jgi:leucyl/phenylalanyl-tRNA--protein transferase
MFSATSDASKVALVALAAQLRRWTFALIDCQVRTEHLARMGAVDLPRATFLQLLECYCHQPGREGPWRLDDDLLADLLISPPP